MKLDIKNLLLIRAESRFFWSSKKSDLFDDMLENVSDTTENRFFCIAPYGIFKIFYDKGLFDNWFVSGLFDLSSPFNETNSRMTLYVLSKNAPKMVKIGNYKETLRGRCSKEDYTLTLFSEYPSEYNEYLNCIESWVNSAITPLDTLYYEFSSIAYDELNFDSLFPQQYSKKSLAINRCIVNEKTTKLSEIAEILIPRRVEKQQKTIFWRDCQYPFKSELIKETDKSSNVLVQKGDIIVSPRSEFYLFDSEIEENLYVSHMYKIIRPMSGFSEYLYLYFNSETAKTIIESISSACTMQYYLTKSKLCSFPVILPEKHLDDYRKAFQLIVYGGNSVSDYLDVSSLLDKGLNSLEAIFSNEISENLLKIKNENIKNVIEADLAEVNSCFKVKAYKATVVLIGSILETYLTDWLGEIHKKDYFKYRYRLPDGRFADLKDIIDEIGGLKYPDWMQERENAHEIRNMRNSIHSSYLLKRELVLDEAICKKMIEYLNEIIEARLSR